MLFGRKYEPTFPIDDTDVHECHREYAVIFAKVYGIADALNALISTPFNTVTAYEELVDRTLTELAKSQDAIFSELKPYFDCVCPEDSDISISDGFSEAFGLAKSIRGIATASLALIPREGRGTWPLGMPVEFSLNEVAREQNKRALALLQDLPTPDFGYSESLSGFTYLRVWTYVLPGLIYEVVCNTLRYGDEKTPILQSRSWHHGAKHRGEFTDNRLYGSPYIAETTSTLEASNKYIEARNLTALMPLSDAEFKHEWTLQRQDNRAEVTVHMNTTFGSRGILLDGCTELVDRAVLNIEFFPEESPELIAQINDFEVSREKVYAEQVMEALVRTSRAHGGLISLNSRVCPDFSDSALTKLVIQESLLKLD